MTAASPPASAAPSVLPSNPPAIHTTSQVATAIGAAIALLVVVVMVIALPARSPAADRPASLDFAKPSAQLNLRSLAAAEETNLTATTKYSADLGALEAVGYAPLPATAGTVRVGVHSTKGYCLVATNGAPAPWYLYDSKQGGLINTGFASEALAEQACADPKIASYTSLR